jgi:mRNA-degrading endonuclease YafQ of YafQ-DinJ toxin-antitoxin module
MNIAWTPKSLRSFKRLIRKDPNLRPLIEQALLQLAEDPFCPSLRTHKLKGELANVWLSGLVQLTIIIVFCLNFLKILKTNKKLFCCSIWELMMKYIDTKVR